MGVESLASSMPVLIDLVLVLAESLSGKRLREAFVEQLGERSHLIDGSTDPKTRTQDLSLKVDALELRVTREESWWNDHELAASHVSAFLRVDAQRTLSLWVEENRSIHWRCEGLSAADVELVTQQVGRPPAER